MVVWQFVANYHKLSDADLKGAFGRPPPGIALLT